MSTTAPTRNSPLERLRYHVSGAVARGEAVPIVAVTCEGCADPVNHPHAFDCGGAR